MIEPLAIDLRKPAAPHAGRAGQAAGDPFALLLGASLAADSASQAPVPEPRSHNPSVPPAAPAEPAAQPRASEQPEPAQGDEAASGEPDAPHAALGTSDGASAAAGEPPATTAQAKGPALQTGPAQATPQPAGAGPQADGTQPLPAALEPQTAAAPQTKGAPQLPDPAQPGGSGNGSNGATPDHRPPEVPGYAAPSALTQGTGANSDGPDGSTGDAATDAPKAAQPGQTAVAPGETPPSQGGEPTAGPGQAVPASELAAPNRLNSEPGRALAEAASQGGAAASAPRAGAPSAGTPRAGARQHPSIPTAGTTAEQPTDSQASKTAGQPAAAQQDAAERAGALADRLAGTTAAERGFQAQLQRSVGAESQSAAPPLAEEGPPQALPQQQAANAGEAPLSGSTPKPVPTTPGTQIAVQIHMALANRLQRFSIRLEPAELGRIDVRLDFRRDGQVRAMIAAERPETLDLLQKDVQGLERALRDAGTNAEKLSLSFNLQGGGRQGGGHGSEPLGSAADNAAEGGDAETDEPPAEQAAPSRRVDALVDLHV